MTRAIPGPPRVRDPLIGMAIPLEELVGRWRAAEERLYPVVMVRPELYERYLGLVRAIADELRWVGTAEALAEAFEQSPAIVAGVVERTATPTEGMDLGLVTGAAFALRHREVMAEIGRARAMRRVREARDAGKAWALVYETDPATGAPYRRLEVHLADGVGLHAFVRFDAETGAAVYAVEALQLDPHTGDRVEDSAPLIPLLTFEDEAEWRRAVEDLRARLAEPA